MLTNRQARLAESHDLPVEDRIDAICDCFEHDWKQGARPEIAAYLDFCDPPAQPRLLTELLLLDWELRSSRGEQPSWDEYLTKLPRFANQIEAARFKHQAQSLGDTSTRSPQQNLSRIARFELLEKIGSGASGDVWKARDTLLQRIVAAKLPRNLHLTEEELSRFLREGQAAAELKHPNIAAVHEVGCANGTAYLISDFIAGQNLRNWLKQSPPSFSVAAKLCQEIAVALAYAHSHGVIHRDLKPANVLLDEGGSPHIVDFGLAKRASSQASVSTQCHVIGTPAYMSPEQASGGCTDQRSDVYSLGVMLYEMIAGRQPFEGSLDEVICAVLTKEPVRLRRLNRSIPRDLELICLKAIAKQPADRYQTADEMADDLNCYLSGVPIRARRYRTAVLAWRGVRRKVATIGLAVIALIAVCLAIKGGTARFAGVPALQPRSVRLTTTPPGAHVVFVPLSPTDGEPMAERAITATGVSPVQSTLAPGDYWVEAVLPGGRFHEVFRHVPKSGERAVRSENHLRWAEQKDGGIEVPNIEIPSKDFAQQMLLVDTSHDSLSGDSDDNARKEFPLVSFYVKAEGATAGEYLKLNPLLSNYLRGPQLQPNQPIPLTYDDAVCYAEAVGMRLPTRAEWQRARTVLPPRSANQLAEWTTTWSLRASAIGVTAAEQTEDHLRLALGGSNRLVRQDGPLEPTDYDANNWAALQRGRFFPGVGVLCVRSAAPRFFKDP